MSRTAARYMIKKKPYIYDEDTGTFACEYDGGITGKISGNNMTLTDRYGTYTLTRK